MEYPEFSNSRPDVRRKHIRDHRHYLGQRKLRHIRKGEAVFDFFNTILHKPDLAYLKDIFHLDDKKYIHCCVCGALYDDGFKVMDAPISLDMIWEYFNISSGLCDPCKQNKDIYEKLEKAKIRRNKW